MAELTAQSSSKHGGVRRKRISTRIDLTAMVDLAFLLITFFILTTTLAKPKAFNLTMPDTPDDGAKFDLADNRTMNIVLGKNNQVVSYLGMTEKPLTSPQTNSFGKQGLRQSIIELSKRVTATTHKELFVIIKPSDHSDYGNLVAALDELHIAGATGYAIVDITPKEVALLKQKGVY